MIREKRSLLIVCYTPPYPPISGGKLSLYGTIDYLRDYFDISLFIGSFSAEDSINNEKLKSIWNNVNIYETKNYFNKKDRKKNFLLRAKSYVARKIIANKNTQNNRFESASFKFPFQLQNQTYVDDLIYVINNNKFDIIQVEFTPYLNLVNILPAKAIKIYVEIESRHKVLKDYFKNSSLAKDEEYIKYTIENVKFFEHQLMSRFDAIFALNYIDEKELRVFVPKSKVYYCPFPILDERIKNSESTIDSYTPEKLVFVGSENHYPNLDGLEWFIKDIIPILPKSLKMHITGKWSVNAIDRMTSDQVVFTGFLESLDEILVNSIMVVPMRIGGGGIRAKILEGMAFGTPVISTDLAAVGISNVVSGKHLLIANTAKEFSSAVEQLLSNKQLCLDIIIAANSLIKMKYSQKVCGDLRIRAYKDIFDSKES